MPEEEQRPADSPLSGVSEEAARRGDIAPLTLSEAERRAIQARASLEGIVTILFTDVVQSTRLRQRLGDEAAQELFREHNRIVRAQIEKHGGFEVKTQGDGFMVAFSDVVGALACAMDIQRAIGEHNREQPGQQFQVRMGLNCGRTIKEEEDFFGSAVVVAARIAALAKGGQILASETVRGLAGTSPGIRYLHHGRHRLKGLAGSYDTWSVPWREAEAEGLARLWARPAFRLTAAALLLAAVGGGIAGGLVLSRGSDGGSGAQVAATVQEVAINIVAEGRSQRVSGNCVSEDLVYRSTSEGEVSGDISGHIAATGDSRLYAVGECQSGLSKATFTITDAEGNALFGTTEGPSSIARLLGEGASAGSTVSAAIITGGTGIYEGATGKGTCTTLSVHSVEPDGTAISQSESDCRYELATAGAAAAAREPVIVQVGVGSTEVTVFGGAGELPNTVAMVVLYRNTREEEQKGLSLRLPEPGGTQILAAARGEEQPVDAGERVWALPDLPPGAIQRFEFTLQFLAAEMLAVPLVVEMEGEGFQEPVSSDPVMITVVQ